MKILYTIFMVFNFCVFIFVSALMLPIAFFKSMIFKLQQLIRARTTS